MARYIDADALIIKLMDKGIEGLQTDDWHEIQQTVEDMPSADVAPVVHSKWVWDKDGMDWGLGAWRCPECGNKPETWWETDPKNPYRCSGSHYCPNCGARMGKKEEG